MSKKSNMILVISGFVVFLTTISFAQAGLQCERITVPACQGLGYNLTAMPNLAGHQNQNEAELMINALEPILESGCSKHARFLFCAAMFPLCSPDVPKPVPTCKSLCETVKQECSIDPLLWPSFLDCDALPQPEKQQLCMQVPQEAEPTVISHHANLWPRLNWKLPNTYLLKLPSVTTCPVNFTLSFDECVPQCHMDAMFMSHQKKLAETWILVLAAICFLFTLFSLVTFWTETTRFGFPERPVLFLTLCYNLLSICYLERIIFHNRNIESMEDDLMGSGGICDSNPPCLASYITTSYLTLSAASWWLIFGLCWYLSTEKQWSSEALERKSGIFHVLAWVPPLAPPIGALLWGAVKPHELTGLCTAPGFTEVPALILLISGAVFIIMAAKSLKRIQHSCHYDKLSQMMTRILLFGCIYFIPAFLAVLLAFFEEVDPLVTPCLPGDACVPPEKSSPTTSLVRLFFVLFGGSLTGMWVWSRKTCNSCRSRISSTSPTQSCAAAIMIKSTTSLPKNKTKICGNNRNISSGTGGMGAASSAAAVPLFPGIQFQSAPISSNIVAHHSRV